MSVAVAPTKTRYQHFADSRWFIRLWEIFPGFISWAFLLSPVVLSLFQPLWVAYFIVAFDLYWLIKALRMSTYLIRGYLQLRRAVQIDWLERLDWLKDPAPFIKKADRRLKDLIDMHPEAVRPLHLNKEGRKYRAKYLALSHELDTLKEIESHTSAIYNPDDIIHLAIVATYNETRDIIEPTIQGIISSNYPAAKIMLVIAYEERGGAQVKATAEDLIEKYGSKFAYAQAIMHPDGIAGEIKGKGGNITFAGRKAAAYIEQQQIDPERVIVTTFDADNKPDKEYFACLSYHYALDPNRIHKSYQPIPMFYNNIWDAPAPMRVIATSNSFWMLIEMTRPHRLRNFSSHAQPLRALIETDFWSVTSPVEDGHQYWRSFYTFNGDYSVVALPVPVYQDAVLADNYLKTFKVQYIQLRRWAYGVSDFQYVMRNNVKNSHISLWSKTIQTWRLFEGHFSWATATLVITFVAWLPLFLNERFSHQELAHQLPIIASRLQSIALLGLFVTVSISYISLPPKPERYGSRRRLAMLAQWALLPVTGVVFNSIAALDAQTRLMIGRYLGFNVTEKSRRK